jgi:hypothetical protein
LGFHVYFFSFQSALAVEHFFFTNTLELFNCSVLDAFIHAFHVELFMNASFLLNYAGVFLLCRSPISIFIVQEKTVYVCLNLFKVVRLDILRKIG